MATYDSALPILLILGRFMNEHEHPQALPCVTVDQFLEDQGITMNQNDLIKIDAEGLT